MNEKPIPFNKPYIAGKELFYIAQAVALGNIGGDGHFTQRCSQILERSFGVAKTLLTPSCTAALEMAAILGNLGPGDEVLMPSFTFVSTANAVVRLGAKPIFVEIRPDTLNIDERLLERTLTKKTKAVIPVHYAGVGCEMDDIMGLAEAYNLIVIEDAAQGVNAFFKQRALGSIGHLGAYSFHETKNYVAGEGGALCINDTRFIERAEIIRDKGTNRKQFFRGLVDKYTWVDAGSSYVPSEIVSAFLCGQLEALAAIAARRREIYEFYHDALRPLSDRELVTQPVIPAHCQSNYHLYHLLLPTAILRDRLLEHLNEKGINAVFHYVPLHNSPMGRRLASSETLPITEDLSTRLVRLPMFYEISAAEQARVVDEITGFVSRI